MKFLINHGSKLVEKGQPTVVYEMGEDEITITAEESKISGLKLYFENPENGWEDHLESDNPLESMGRNTSMAKLELTDDSDKATRAKKDILNRGGKEVTVSWASDD